MQGIFITMEGPDGAGKTTQIELLKDYLNKKGYDVLITRDPGGNAVSEAIREVILNKDFTEMGYMTELLLYAAARAQLVKENINRHYLQAKQLSQTVLWIHQRISGNRTGTWN